MCCQCGAVGPTPFEVGGEAACVDCASVSQFHDCGDCGSSWWGGALDGHACPVCDGIGGLRVSGVRVGGEGAVRGV